MSGPISFRFGRLLSSCAAVAALTASFAASGQSAAIVAHSAQILGRVDASQTTRLSGHVPVYADTAKLRSTAMSPEATFARLNIVLKRAPEVEAAFQQLLADQQNVASPRYHQWLLPAQVGQLYGPAQSDVDAVTQWLQSKGLSIVEISPSRTIITFSGPVSVVSGAFATEFRQFSLANGETRYSLTSEPAVPAAIAPTIKAISGLSQIIHHPSAQRGAFVPATTSSLVTPDLNSSSGAHYLVAGDFAVAYDLNPLYASGYNGTGQKIAIVGESRVNASDIANLQTYQGQTVKQPTVYIPPTGTDPGIAGDVSGVDNGFQDEATLDVDRTTGNAPGATIDLVVSGDVRGASTFATDGLFIAINYAINTLNDPILSISFGGCEYVNGASAVQYEDSIAQTAAAQGISVFVSSGDDGAGSCKAFDDSTHNYDNILSVNDLCTPTVTCMGGTEFNDSTNASTYWNTTNGTNHVSLKSYIPEGAWNDISVSNSGVYSEGGSGGGVSMYMAKPNYQTGAVFTGNFRWIPDMALTSSPHDGFVTCLSYLKADCLTTGFYAFGGTSAAAPSMAAIQAIANQRLGGRQGNINPTLYALGSTSPSVFHDVTVASSGVSNCVLTTPSLCNNSLPTSSSLLGGLPGYAVANGWDAVTGWGSLDAANYVQATAVSTVAVSPASTSLALSASAGTTVTDTIALTSINAFSGNLVLACTATTASGTAVGTCSVSPTTTSLTAGGIATATLTVGHTSTATGTLTVVVTATSGGTTASSPVISVTVGAGSLTIVPAAHSLTFTSGASTGNTTALALTSQGGLAGSVALTCSISSSAAYYQPSCSVAPNQVTLTANGTATATLTISSTAAVQATAAIGHGPLSLPARLFPGGSAFALLFGFLGWRRKQRHALRLLTMSLFAFTCFAVSGCGEGGNVPSVTTTPVKTVTHSSAGTYLVTVTGISGTTTASANVVVVIN